MNLNRHGTIAFDETEGPSRGPSVYRCITIDGKTAVIAALRLFAGPVIRNRTSKRRNRPRSDCNPPDRELDPRSPVKRSRSGGSLTRRLLWFRRGCIRQSSYLGRVCIECQTGRRPLAAGSLIKTFILRIFLAWLPPNPKFHRQEIPAFVGAHQ